MPANLPPEYFEVEKKYRQARTIQEKIAVLRELLSLVPKHKGTEKLQAEIKSKIARLRREAQEEKKTGRRTHTLYPRRQGAAQVALIGPPNAGKSSLLARLTSAHPTIAPFPFSTTLPVAGMMPYEDIQIQLVDTSPILEDHVDPWVLDIARGADLLVLVLSLATDDLLDHFEVVTKRLEKHGITLVGSGVGEDALFGPVRKRTLIVATHLDAPDAQDRLEILRADLHGKFPLVAVSSETLEGLDQLPQQIFQELGIIRVYTKKPGKDPVLENPLILKQGMTVLDAAEKLHKDFARNLKFARLWGPSARFPGQRVERDHILADGDIVEFHV